MNVFQRGDYRAFIVVAPANDIDRALFAYPVFEGEEVSNVFNYYKYMYIPDAAKIKMTKVQIDNPCSLGAVFAKVDVGSDKFYVSTVTPQEALWTSVVQQWEDKWVFDHLMSSKGSLPEKESREFKGGLEVQNRVADSYSHYLTMYIWAAITAFAAWTVMSSTVKDRD